MNTKRDWLRHLRVVSIIAIGFTVIVAITESRAAAPTSPTDLLTQYVTNPLAVDTVPHFSWTCHDNDRGETPTAYQIIVSSTLAGISGDVGDIWDSGKKTSSASTQVHFTGSSLAASTRYWWKVRSWDKDGNASPYSSSAFFDYGLRANDWTASFIWDGTSNVNNFAYFRKKFTLAANQTVSLAKIYVSAHDDYKLFVNGKEIGTGPARANPYKVMQYNGYDVTELLVSGDNVIAAIGHFHGIYQSAGMNAVPGFILEARIKFGDGSSQTIKTDNTWKTLANTPWTETPYTYLGADISQSRCVENYDARKEVDGWQMASFNDASWSNAVVVDRKTFTLKAQYVARDTVWQMVDPVSVTSSGATWVVDFGKCYNGWPSLTMTGNAAGSKVTVHYAETPNNYIDSDTYICKGGTETWKPDIGHESFRCLKVAGYAGTLTAANIKAAWSFTNANKTGNFECSNTLFNTIYTLCDRSSRQNIQQGMVSVDAWREQSSYTADAYILAGNCIYNDKNSLVLQKTIRDYAGDQRSNGNLNCRAPSTSIKEIPEWTFHWVFMLWNQYLFFGDRDLLVENYPVLQRIFNFFNTYRSSTTNLLTNTPGWEISDWPSDPTDNSGSALTAQNSLYYHALMLSTRIASVIGKTSDSASYGSIAAKVKDGINTQLFDGVRKYKDCSGSTTFHTLSSCWPLMFDIVPDNKKDSVIAYVKRNGYTAKVYGGCWAMDALFKCDQGPYIDTLLDQPTQRWGNFLSTAYSQMCWEDWGGKTYNHAWSSYPARFFLSGMLGINPTAGGFGTFEFKPQISGLTHASGIVPTVKGDISASWTTTGNVFDLKVSVPVCCTCLVYLPFSAKDSADVYEGGTCIWKRGKLSEGAAGVVFVKEEGNRLVWQMGSGAYEFSNTAHPTAVAPIESKPVIHIPLRITTMVYGGVIFVPGEYQGKTVGITVFDLSGRCLGRGILSKPSVNLQKEFGISKGIHIVRYALNYK